MREDWFASSASLQFSLLPPAMFGPRQQKERRSCEGRRKKRKAGRETEKAPHSTKQSCLCSWPKAVMDLPDPWHETSFWVSFYFSTQSAQVQMLLSDSVFHDTCQRHMARELEGELNAVDRDYWWWGACGMHASSVMPMKGNTIKDRDYFIFPSRQSFGLLWALLFCFVLFLPYSVVTLKR